MDTQINQAIYPDSDFKSPPSKRKGVLITGVILILAVLIALIWYKNEPQKLVNVLEITLTKTEAPIPQFENKNSISVPEQREFSYPNGDVYYVVRDRYGSSA